MSPLVVIGAAALLVTVVAGWKPMMRWSANQDVWRLEVRANYRDEVEIIAIRPSGGSMPIVSVDATKKTPEEFAEIVAQGISDGETKLAVLNGAQRDVDRTRP